MQSRLDAETTPTTDAAALSAWLGSGWPVAEDWRPVTDAFWPSPPGRSLKRDILQRLAAGAVVYPLEPLRALALTPLSRVSVVILGQDPYHGPGQAEGLAFSVACGQRLPPSLRNIFRERQRDLGLPVPAHGSLRAWAERGALLLNACLTVEQGRPASHAGLGWEVLTGALVDAVARRPQPCVWMLWGAHAQAKVPRIAAARSAGGGDALVLTANHPSPLSATRPPQPFVGCGHFSRARAWLSQRGIAIDFG